jgi:cobalt-precorrin-6B (C15)-methyltransferase
MPEPKLPGGPTQDEIMAVSLLKLGLCPTDTVLEIGCGTGKVSVAMAKQVKKVFAVDKRPEAISFATETARLAGVSNIGFSCMNAVDYLRNGQEFDCAFIGGTQDISEIIPLLAKRVKRNIVINAVMVNTLERAVTALKDLGIFTEVVQVQVSRSYDIAGSIMFRPIDPVFVIVARGAACS